MGNVVGLVGDGSGVLILSSGRNTCGMSVCMPYDHAMVFVVAVACGSFQEASIQFFSSSSATLSRL